MRLDRKLLGFAVAAAALVGLQAPASAVPLSDLINNNGTIIDGDKIFSNFSFSIASAVGNTVADVNQLQVNPLGGSTVGLSITGGLAAFGAGSFLDVILGYTVTVLDPNQRINELSLLFNGQGTGLPGLDDVLVSITEQATFNGGVVGQIAVSAPLDLQDPPFEVVDIPLNGLFTTLDIEKDIIIAVAGNAAAGTGGTISTIDQDYGQVQVPEPATLALIGAGLVGAGLLRRRKAA